MALPLNGRPGPDAYPLWAHRTGSVLFQRKLRAYIEGWNKRAHPIHLDQDRRRLPQEGRPSNNFKSAPLVVETSRNERRSAASTYSERPFALHYFSGVNGMNQKIGPRFSQQSTLTGSQPRTSAALDSWVTVMANTKVLLVAAVAILGSVIAVDAAPVHASVAPARPVNGRVAPMKPEAIQTHFNDQGRKGVLVVWNVMTGDGGTVQYNTIKLIPRNGCPCKTYTRQCNCVYIPYKDFPRRRSAVKIQITAHGWDGGTAVGSTKLKTAARAYRVSTNRPVRAAQEANSCLDKGLAAGVITGGAGTMVLGISYFVPGVGEVTGAGVAAASLSTGTSTYVACLIGW